MKKLLAVVLSLSMVLCSFSLTAFAGEPIELPDDPFEEEEAPNFTIEIDEWGPAISIFVGDTPIDEVLSMTEDNVSYLFPENPTEDLTLTFKFDNTEEENVFTGLFIVGPEEDSTEWVRHWYKAGTNGVVVDSGELQYTFTVEMQSKCFYLMPVTWDTVFDGEMMIYNYDAPTKAYNHGAEVAVSSLNAGRYSVNYGDSIALSFTDEEGEAITPYAIRCDVDYNYSGIPTYTKIVSSDSESDYYEETFESTGEFIYTVPYGLGAHLYIFYSKEDFEMEMFKVGEGERLFEITLSDLGSVVIPEETVYSKRVIGEDIQKYAIDEDLETFVFQLSEDSDRINFVNINGSYIDRQMAIDRGILSFIVDPASGAKTQVVTVSIDKEDDTNWIYVDFENDYHAPYEGFRVNYDDDGYELQVLEPNEAQYRELGSGEGIDFPYEYEESDKYCVKVFLKDSNRVGYGYSKWDSNTEIEYICPISYVDEGEDSYYYFEIPFSDFNSDLNFDLIQEATPFDGEFALNFDANGRKVYNYDEGTESYYDPWDNDNNCRRMFKYNGDIKLGVCSQEDESEAVNIFALRAKMNDGTKVTYCVDSTYAATNGLTYNQNLASGFCFISDTLLNGQGVNIDIWFDSASYEYDNVSTKQSQRIVEFGIEQGDGALAFDGAYQDYFSKYEGNWQKVILDADERKCTINITDGEAYGYNYNGKTVALESGVSSFTIDLDPYNTYTNVRVFFLNTPKFWIDYNESDTEVRFTDLAGELIGKLENYNIATTGTTIAIIPNGNELRGINIQENDGALTSVPASELTKITYAGGSYYTYTVPYIYNPDCETRIWAFSGSQPLCGEFVLSTNDGDGTVKMDGVKLETWDSENNKNIIHSYTGDSLTFTYESTKFDKPYAIKISGLCMEDQYFFGDDVPEGGITIPVDGRGLWINIWWDEAQYIFDETYAEENQSEIFIRTNGMDYDNAMMVVSGLDKLCIKKAVYGDAIKYIVPNGAGPIDFTVASYNCSIRGVNINGVQDNTSDPYPMSYEFKDIDVSNNVEINLDMCYDDEEAEIKGMLYSYSLVIGSDFALHIDPLFMPHLADNMKLKVYLGEELISELDARPAMAGRYWYLFTKIGAQHMTDKFTLQLVYKDGETETILDERENVSVQAYVDDMHSENDGEDAVLEQLLRDTLEYGKLAQLYTGYNTGSLADEPSWAASITPTEFVPVTETDKTITATIESGTKIKAATLVLGTAVSIKLTVGTNDVEGLILRAVNREGEQVILLDELTADGQNYYVYLDEISFSDIDMVYTITLERGTQVLQTVTYSVKSYVYAMQADTGALGNLVKAIYCLGISSKAYADSNKDE